MSPSVRGESTYIPSVIGSPSSDRRKRDKNGHSSSKAPFVIQTSKHFTMLKLLHILIILGSTHCPLSPSTPLPYHTLPNTIAPRNLHPLRFAAWVTHTHMCVGHIFYIYSVIVCVSFFCRSDSAKHLREHELQKGIVVFGRGDRLGPTARIQHVIVWFRSSWSELLARSKDTTSKEAVIVYQL